MEEGTLVDVGRVVRRDVFDDARAKKGMVGTGAVREMLEVAYSSDVWAEVELSSLLILLPRSMCGGRRCRSGRVLR